MCITDSRSEVNERPKLEKLLLFGEELYPIEILMCQQSTLSEIGKTIGI